MYKYESKKLEEKKKNDVLQVKKARHVKGKKGKDITVKEKGKECHRGKKGNKKIYVDQKVYSCSNFLDGLKGMDVGKYPNENIQMKIFK